MSVEDRLALLERLEVVPADGDVSDYNIAQKTTWWGHRLDPVTFWSNRVVWLDEQNIADANRRGRGYPPIPFHDSRFDNRDDTNEVFLGEVSAEGPVIQFHDTNREGAFWDKFGREHPRPPNDLLKRQQEEAEWLFHTRDDFERRGNPGRLTRDSLVEMQQSRLQQALDLGYPIEAFSEDTQRLTYMAQMTAEYSSALAAEQSGNPLPMKKFKRSARLDIDIVSQPMSDADRNALDAWKTAYLRRLRAEKTDESYIAAYIKAWNLDPKVVFSEP